MKKRTKIALGVLVAVLIFCGAFFGAAWGSSGTRQASPQGISPAPAAPQKDYTQNFKDLQAAVAELKKTNSAQSPQPVTVTVNQPPVTVNPPANVTVSQSVSGTATETTSTSKLPTITPYQSTTTKTYRVWCEVGTYRFTVQAAGKFSLYFDNELVLTGEAATTLYLAEKYVSQGSHELKFESQVESSTFGFFRVN